MTEKKYIGIYYPNSFIENENSLTTFTLFFDELHLVTIADMAKDPTNYLKNLSSPININVIGKPKQEELEKTKQFYQFALNNQKLIGQILFYHPHLLDSSINSISSKLLSGTLSPDELLNFFLGKTTEQEAINKFIEQFPNINDEFIFRSAPTAIKLSEDNDWILISDNPELPIPYLSEKISSVKFLTTILAEECIRISLPKSISLNAEDILIVRDKLQDQLIPFRMAMQKLSSVLKSTIKDNQDMNKLRAEAKFIAESQVEPAMYELRRKIEIEKDKLWIKVFGKAISWIPFIAKGFATPTPDNIFKAMGKIYGDVETISSAIQNIDIAKEPGICYLLKLDRIITKK